MAPDRDDHDDTQATNGAHDGVPSPDPAPDAPAAALEDPRRTGAPGGDADTEGVTGTIAGGGSQTGSGPVVVAESGDADTEGTIADVENPATERPATEGSPDDHDSGWVHDAESESPAPEFTEAETGSPEFIEAEADTEAGDDGIGTGDSPPVPVRSRRKAVVLLTVLSLLVVGLGVGGLIWARRSKNDASPPPSAATAPPSTLSEGAFVTFHDSETGFSIRYPRGWTRSEAPVREVRLLVSDGTHYSALVRVTRTAEPTTPANLANIKAVTDGIVAPGAQILKQDPISVNGLIGYRYIYTITDKGSGLTTAHLHYFLFQGHKMNSVVFEAVPTEGFDRIQGTFEQMLESFRSDPEPP